MSTHHIFLPHSSAKLRALNRHSATARIHGGGGTVLLDGGIGGQSSYQSIDDYMNITGRDPYNNKMMRPQTIPALKSGSGLADKIASKLSKLSLDKPKKPKKKNIVMSF
jgi:hypothetical protein